MVVFEPNDAPLWMRLRTDAEADRLHGVVHILVGFVPLKRAEFVTFIVRLRTAR